jgi:hypothetical protein
MRLPCELVRERLVELRALQRSLADEPDCREHLLACPACLGFLEQEEALEDVLLALEVPEAPAELAARVLAALGPARRGDPGDPAAGEDGALAQVDRLLALVPAPATPRGLARHVLERLASERPPHRRPARARAALVVAAVLLLVGYLAFRSAQRAPEQLVAEAELQLEQDEELVSYTLENWELVTSEDLDLLLGSLGAGALEPAQEQVSGEEGTPRPRGKDGRGKG